MTAGRRLVLLRHGRTAWNAIGRAQGHADIGLDDLGRAQAEAAAEVLADWSAVALWSSDLARARETAAYVEKATGLTIRLDPRLREYDVGDRQGLTLEEFSERYPDEYASWAGGDDLVAVPGAETTEQVLDRTLSAYRDCLAELAAGETGIVVTHGASLKIGLVGLLGWPSCQGAALRGMDNCRWAVIEELTTGGKVRLASYNLATGSDPGTFARGPADR